MSHSWIMHTWRYSRYVVGGRVPGQRYVDLQPAIRQYRHARQRQEPQPGLLLLRPAGPPSSSFLPFCCSLSWMHGCKGPMSRLGCHPSWELLAALTLCKLLNNKNTVTTTTRRRPADSGGRNKVCMLCSVAACLLATVHVSPCGLLIGLPTYQPT